MSPTLNLPAQSPMRDSFNFLPQSYLLVISLILLVPYAIAGSPVSPATTLSVKGKIPTGVATQAYSATITASGGTGPYVYKAAGLPRGLKINHATGVIAGTCNTVGQYPFSIYATDSAGHNGKGSFSVTFTQPPVSISLAPGTVTIPSAGTQQFLATVLNATNTSVTWAATAGTISSTGSYTAPTVTSNTTATITATSVADTTKEATASVTISTAPVPPVSMELLFPPTSPGQPYYDDVQKYLLSNPVVAGVTVWLEWSSADNGPSASPQYDFSAFDARIAPFIGAGKKVNIIVWAVSDDSTNTATPQYVWNNLGSSNQTTCGGEKFPNYFQSAFQLPYQAFMAQMIKHYRNNGSIGYIRMGLGRGGETYPAPGFGNDPCTNTFISWGWTATTWTNYVDAMLTYQSTLHSPKQLMVGIDRLDTVTMPQSEAATAVSLGMAFGNEGMEASDITNYPYCSSDWCNLFNQYTGSAPLELQTVALSSPEDKPPVGSLVKLLPFAVSHHATIFEIYCYDWLLAFDPNYPGHATYGVAYAATFKSVAQGK